MRLHPILSVAALILASCALGKDVMPLRDPPILTATPVALERGNPSRTRVGALRYLDGWVLQSPDGRFGSISALWADRGRFTAIADTGQMFRFRMDDGGKMSEVAFLPLPGVPNPADDKKGRDSESITVDRATGRAWIGFEQYQQIWRYAPGLARAEAHAAPAAMKDWPENGGPESLVRLRDGRFIVFAEQQEGPGDTFEALLFAGDPTDPATPPPLRFFYRGVAGYLPTDAAELPDGHLILLNRHFTLMDGVSAVVTIVDPRAIAKDAIVAGREIARLASPLTVDNMEAISVEQEGGRTILWIASDDNQQPIQRTLLMKFALEEGPRQSGP